MISILFFIISFFFLVLFLFIKVKHFNEGSVQHHFPHIVEAIKEDLRVVKTGVQKHVKKTFKKSIFTIGKLWIIFIFVSEKKLRKHFPKLFSTAPEPGHKPSFFLSTIMEYKMRMKYFKKKIREEDDRDDTQQSA